MKKMVLVVSMTPVMLTDYSGYWSWSKFWYGISGTVATVVCVSIIVVSAPISVPAAAAIIAATAVTGLAYSYADANNEVLVMDVSATGAIPIEGLGYKIGISFVVDFEKNSSELYVHGGGVYGVGTGVTYGVGYVTNYNGRGSYGGPFHNVGANYIIGFDHCYDPRFDYNDTVKASSITFGVGSSGYSGMDYYANLFYYDWSE